MQLVLSAAAHREINKEVSDNSLVISLQIGKQADWAMTSRSSLSPLQQNGFLLLQLLGMLFSQVPTEPEPDGETLPKFIPVALTSEILMLSIISLEWFRKSSISIRKACCMTAGIWSNLRPFSPETSLPHQLSFESGEVHARDLNVTRKAWDRKCRFWEVKLKILIFFLPPRVNFCSFSLLFW